MQAFFIERQSGPCFPVAYNTPQKLDQKIVVNKIE